MIAEIIAYIFMGLGAFFLLTGSVGVLRFKSFFERTHAAGVSDSCGVVFVLLGLCVYAGFGLVMLKLVALAVFVLLTSPTACHALARAAFIESNRNAEKPSQKQND